MGNEQEIIILKINPGTCFKTERVQHMEECKATWTEWETKGYK